MLIPYYTRIESDIQYNKLLETFKETSTGFLGTIDLTSVRDINKVGFWVPTEDGIYPEFGGVEVDLLEGVIFIVYNGMYFEKVVIPIIGSATSLPKKYMDALDELIDFVPTDYDLIFLNNFK